MGCGIANDKTPRAASSDDLEKLLKENHRYIFSLIHKFNKGVDPKQPYSERDDIIVISDEAHRTQAGRLARNMHLALRTRPSSASLARRSSSRTKLQDASSAITFLDTISSDPRRTGRRSSWSTRTRARS